MSALCERLATRLVDHWVPFEPVDYIRRKEGAVRRRYVTALRQIEKTGFDIDKDSGISAFVKLERYFKEGKPPRMILGRDPKFNIYYAQVIEPMEKAFFCLDEVANGKDHHAMGEMFSRMAGSCRQFYENDMSKYESSQRDIVLLDIEFQVYRRVLQKVQPDLLSVLCLAYAACLRSKCKTNLGVNFSFILCRVSGDLTTSLGNGIVNMITSQYNQVMNSCDKRTCGFDICSTPGCRARDIILKGDDSVLGSNIDAIFIDHYKDFGLDAKLILRKDADSVEFCSGKFADMGGGQYVYLQGLQKLIESLTTCINQDAIDNGWVAHYYKSLGLMYSIIYRGVPVYSDIADFLMRGSDHKLNTKLVTSYNLLQSFSGEHIETPIFDVSTAYLGVSLANDMSFAELNRITSWFRSHRLSFPSTMMKTCRTRMRKPLDVPIVDFPQLNAQVTKYKLPADIAKWHGKCLGRLVDHTPR